ncbi:hypothetical protein [Meiothermus taiwanensis]|jgi:hypothetical protein|uniref:hypothetical protein n=1 Tax=Meiothermus taiwanensis TaxID=172827 RepID=UPI0005B733A9|nr:hypothetical protein [Meiothermus taiwanensis]KIQ54498.1 hypothetical protein SY28_08195 [Meiothermus taiwanensis]
MKKVQPLEDRLKALGGLVPLEPGEVTAATRVRGDPLVVSLFLSLDTRRRGEVVAAGLRVLGLLEGVEDGQETR